MLVKPRFKLKLQPKKPPPIRVGVSGIDATPQRGQVGFVSPEPDGQIDWATLVGLPPFQMYMVEKKHIDVDQLDSMMLPALQAIYEQGSLQKLFEDYCHWHNAKGYWRNEDPFGNLMVDR